MQSPLVFKNISRVCEEFSDDTFPIDTELLPIIISERFVELAAFTILPQSFHLIVKETREGGMATYMQRILTGYTKYFQKRYLTSGHVFSGRYRSVVLKGDPELLRLSAYIHKVPHAVTSWSGREERYPWSSLQDFIGANRWGGLIAPEIIASRFAATSGSNYRDFVKSIPLADLKKEFEKII